MRIVLKLGGAALRDGAAVRRAAEIVRAHGGPAPIVVVSAHEGVTRLLERAAAEAARGRLDLAAIRLRHRTLLSELALPSELLDRPLAELRTVLGAIRDAGALDRRRRDFVLAFGERASARVVALALRAAGVPATPVDAFDVGLASEPVSGAHRPTAAAAARVRDALRAMPGVPVVTGFLAHDRDGHVTTLGRNGSDLTAVWLGAAVGADEVHLWKAVDAICTADPRIVADARPVARLSALAAAELARHGADVLHPAALEPARGAGLAVRVRSVADPGGPGTTIEPAQGAEPLALALAHRRGVARLTLAAETDADDLRAACFDAGIEPFLVAARGPERVALLPDVEAAAALARGVALERGLGTLALVGSAARDEGLPARAVAAAAEGGIALARLAAGDGPQSRLLCVRADRLEAALQLLHDHLVLGAAARPARPLGVGPANAE